MAAGMAPRQDAGRRLTQRRTASRPAAGCLRNPGPGQRRPRPRRARLPDAHPLPARPRPHRPPTAFRRLTHKTQVFVFHEGDHYRTRLTHTLEVAQIARTIARVLGLDEDLAEALALAHDLGHPPFGHAGEDALDAAMAAFGGFDHNAQSLSVVTRLEALCGLRRPEPDAGRRWRAWPSTTALSPVTPASVLRPPTRAAGLAAGCTLTQFRRRGAGGGDRRRHRLRQPRYRRRPARRADRSPTWPMCLWRAGLCAPCRARARDAAGELRVNRRMITA